MNFLIYLILVVTIIILKYPIFFAASIAPHCKSSFSLIITEWNDRAKSKSFLS